MTLHVHASKGHHSEWLSESRAAFAAEKASDGGTAMLVRCDGVATAEVPMGDKPGRVIGVWFDGVRVLGGDA